jgi:hypothetical protein
MLEFLENRRMLSVSPISSLSLINTDTNKPVAGYESLQSGVTLDLAILPPHLSIGAKESASVGSVLFGYDSNPKMHNENYFPYSVNGDSDKGTLTNAWPMSVGSHTLVVTPYQKIKDGGASGSADVLKFTVIKSSPAVITPPVITPPLFTPPIVTPPVVIAPPLDAAPVVTPPVVRPPWIGGSIWVVDPTGANGASKTIAAAIALAQPGDTVLIQPGTYFESIKLTRSGTSGNPITIEAAVNGTAIIDGSGQSFIFDSTFVDYINLQGITFDHCDNPLETAAVLIGSNSMITDVTVQNTESQGMEVYGNNTTLLRVIAQYNGQEGLGGVNANNILVQDCITRFNNPGLVNPSWANSSFATQVNGLWYVNADYEAGAGKWSSTSNVTLDGVQSYSNHGTGIWFDYDNTNVVIKNCIVHDAIPVTAFYEGVGISIELNNIGPVTVENNTIYNCPGGTIDVTSSQHVSATNNILSGSYIALNDWPRGTDYTMEDVSFTHNTMNNTFIWTGGDNWLTTSGAAKDVVFDYNTYSGMTGPIFNWGSITYQHVADVQSGLQLELHGVQTA